jgi:hypothetical protein
VVRLEWVKRVWRSRRRRDWERPERREERW